MSGRLILPPKPTYQRGEYTTKAMETLDKAWHATYELECRLANMRGAFGNWVDQVCHCPSWMSPVKWIQDAFANAQGEIRKLEDPYRYIESLEAKIVDTEDWRMSGHKWRMKRRGYVMKRKPGKRAR